MTAFSRWLTDDRTEYRKAPMSEEDSFNLERYRDRLAEQPDHVPCAHCGRSIPARTTRCPHCRVHFDGLAGDFASGERNLDERRDRLRRIMAYILLIVFFLSGVLGMLCWIL